MWPDVHMFAPCWAWLSDAITSAHCRGLLTSLAESVTSRLSVVIMSAPCKTPDLLAVWWDYKHSQTLLGSPWPPGCLILLQGLLAEPLTSPLCDIVMSASYKATTSLLLNIITNAPCRPSVLPLVWYYYKQRRTFLDVYYDLTTKKV